MRPSASSPGRRRPPAHAVRPHTAAASAAADRRRVAPAAPIPVIAINAALLPTGKVLIYAYPGRPGEPGSGFENRADAHVGHPDDLGSWRR